jgi:hypothetical protein
MSDNRNCQIAFGGKLLFRISIKSLEGFMGCTEKSIYGLIQTTLYQESIWLNIEMPTTS